jgi:hypothetical protein
LSFLQHDKSVAAGFQLIHERLVTAKWQLNADTVDKVGIAEARNYWQKQNFGGIAASFAMSVS